MRWLRKIWARWRATPFSSSIPRQADTRSLHQKHLDAIRVLLTFDLEPPPFLVWIAARGIADPPFAKPFTIDGLVWERNLFTLAPYQNRFSFEAGQ